MRSIVQPSATVPVELSEPSAVPANGTLTDFSHLVSRSGTPEALAKKSTGSSIPPNRFVCRRIPCPNLPTAPAAETSNTPTSPIWCQFLRPDIRLFLEVRPAAPREVGLIQRSRGTAREGPRTPAKLVPSIPTDHPTESGEPRTAASRAARLGPTDPGYASYRLWRVGGRSPPSTWYDGGRTPSLFLNF